MEKRIIIASILSIVVILGWSYILPVIHPVKQLNKNATTVNKNKEILKEPVKNSYAKQTPKANQVTVNNPNNPSKNKEPFISVSKSIKINKKFVYRGKHFYGSFNPLNGSLESLKLLKYSYNEKAVENKVNLLNTKNKIALLNFVSDKTPTSIKLFKIIKNSNSFKFIYKINHNLLITKEYKFLGSKYILQNKIFLKNLSNKPILFKGHFLLSAGLKPATNNADYVDFAPIVYLNKKSISPNITGKTDYTGDISFAGFNSEYFLLSVLAPGKSIQIRKSKNIVNILIPKKILIGIGKTVKINLSVYGGPKKLSLLNQTGHNVNSTLSFGFFGFFSIILLHILEFFYGFVHNYGLAIILLVVAIRVVFFPLTYKGFKSMKQMQKLTPKINELRAKHKDNKAELNKKIMELYKEGRVNPFGGCLPMLLQIPVFYGLYMTLQVAIQLRNAPFIFWIHNLGAQDPYYVLPILMGVSMLISQKMNPVIGDPTQAKIMLILPIVFTFLFIHYPAGLLLYWTVNNILTIAQQYMINRKFA